VLQEVGLDRDGEPRSNVIVVSDHGMAPFHTAVNVGNLLRNAGVDTTKIGIRTSGPAVHVYVDLAGREQAGAVDTATYLTLVDQVATVLRGAQDPNPFFNPRAARLFSDVWKRPTDCGPASAPTRTWARTSATSSRSWSRATTSTARRARWFRAWATATRP
jgi:hypothetical protein